MKLQDQRILITGGHGFLGTHLTSHLRDIGCGHVFTPTHHDYDMLDDFQVRNMLSEIEPTLVFHLAATVGGIGANRARPADFFYENAVMGIHLIESARKAAIAKLVLVGTVCGYPRKTPVPFKEDDFWAGYPEETNAPYGLAKKMLLVQAQAYREQYGLNAIYLIPVNLYGPGDSFDPATSHVVPALVRKFVTARNSGLPEVTLWGTGAATREFLYVADAARALALAAERYDGAPPINVGSGREVTIAELAAKIAALVGYNGAIVYDVSMPDGQPHRCLDVLRAKSHFGFEASTSFDDGLRATIEWFESQMP